MTAGAPVVSLTLAGLSTADLTDGKLTVSFGSGERPEIGGMRTGAV